MEVITCKGCGKLFNYIQGQRLCPACQKMIEDKFVEVKKYVRENPNADIQLVSSEMDVSVRQIKAWIREERLVFSDDSPVGLPCESCGKIIKTGRYCDVCKNTLSNSLRQAAGLNKKPEGVAMKPKKSSESRMRFLDN